MNKNQALWLNQNSDRLASLAYEEYLKRGPGTVVVTFNGIDPVLSYTPVSHNKKLAYSYDPHTQMSVMIGCDVLTLPHTLVQANDIVAKHPAMASSPPHGSSTRRPEQYSTKSFVPSQANGYAVATVPQ